MRMSVAKEILLATYILSHVHIVCSDSQTLGKLNVLETTGGHSIMRVKIINKNRMENNVGKKQFLKFIQNKLLVVNINCLYYILLNCKQIQIKIDF